ncbi:DUF2975 domain-containing protein [Lapidilactobacillus achengensis]|uniref:DUF2975 domain-containing protein n=1 Tax=Lapidilactobacillus achengensis TaxID=2486000 RepID=A0ABW1UPJ1_9LACO|nr:DUF2975 domain-containing protein [Lapidilactobacillus achengensis]
MKRETRLLQLALLVLALGLAAVAAIVIPHFLIGLARLFPGAWWWPTLMGIGLYLTALLFAGILWQAGELVRRIQRRQAFALASVTALARLRNQALAISLIYALELPIFFIWADRDDAPGLLALAIVFVGAALVIGVFAGVLKQLLQQALELQEEHDLTI